MTIATVLPVMTAIAVGAEVVEGVSRIGAAEEQRRALEQQQKEITISTQQKTLSHYEAAEKLIQAQMIAESTNGTAFSSPSFNAIQRSTINTISKQLSNDEIEGNIAEENNRIEQRNVNNTLFSQLFGQVADFGIMASKAATKIPKGKI